MFASCRRVYKHVGQLQLHVPTLLLLLQSTSLLLSTIGQAAMCWSRALLQPSPVRSIATAAKACCAQQLTCNGSPEGLLSTQ